MRYLKLIHILLLILLSQKLFAEALNCRGILEKNSFNTFRTLSDYSGMLTPVDRSFQQKVANLPEDSLVIDMGAGEAHALKHIITKYDHIKKAIAVGYKKPKNFQSPSASQDRFEYLEGDLLKIKELDQYRGQVELITDVYGPLSYIEKDFQKVLQTYLDLLKVNGRLFFVLREETNYILSADFPYSSWTHFFKSIKGVEVKVHSRPNNKEIYTSFEIKKTNENAEITSQLIEKKYEASAPAKRVFSLASRIPLV